MAFSGGPINVLGITPSFLAQLGTQTAQNGVQQALGQVWQGAGQSFLGSAGQSLAGNLAGSAVNIALNSVLGTKVTGPQGLSLTSGANLLASTISPYVTSQVAAGINQSIQKSLQSAGPFGPALSTLGTGLVNQFFGGLTGSITGAASQQTNYKMFPGGGQDEAPSDYGGNRYTLDDVVFSLQPANQGPQRFGLASSFDNPLTSTKMSFNQLANLPLTAGSPVANTIKQASMGIGDPSKLPFDPKKVSTSSSFNVNNWISPNFTISR